MDCRLYDEMAVIRLDPGEDIATALTEVCRRWHIGAATVSGIGAVDSLTVGVFDLAERAYRQFDYTGNHEINALVGNVTTKDGEPYVHLHITCTDLDGRVVGGHLLRSRVSLTVEMVLCLIEGRIERTFDPELGINRMDFGH